MERAMGLDAVELIMETESTFGISIDDGAAERLSTVGDLFAHVALQIRVCETARCLSQVSFYKLRNALVLLFGTRRLLSVHPRECVCYSPLLRQRTIVRSCPSE